ncbi:MAG: TldD/PmbA family protein, partial [Erysipelotrichaceae bacterium]|nr:TldD/PmbA family protein [Erysipelotrichaceae bacterium]
QFSSFVMNPMTGDFGGEIRLAYYYDGKTVTPVTGGSMTADISEVIKTIRLSRETEQYDYCLVPRTIRLLNVAISGEE